jgi:hypothetical protein
MRLWFACCWALMLTASPVYSAGLARPIRSSTATSASPVSPPPAGTKRVALGPLQQVGTSEFGDGSLDSALKRIVQALPSTEAVDLAGSKCAAEALTCWRSAGRKLGATHVAFGSVERFGEGHALRVRLVETEGTAQNELKRFVAGGASELQSAVEQSACELLAPGTPCQGTFILTGLTGARLFVDGREVSAVPARQELRPGLHQIRVQKGERSTEGRLITVAPGRTIEWQVQESNGVLTLLEEAESLPLPPDLLLEEPPGEPAPVAAPPLTAAPVAPPAPTLAPAPVVVPDPPQPPMTVTPPPAPALPLAPDQAEPVATTTTLPRPAAARPEPSAEPTAVETPAAVAKTPESARWLLPAFQGASVLAAVGLTTGVILGIVAQARAGSLNAAFDARELQPSDIDRYGSIRATATASNLFYGLGALGLVGAAGTYLVQPTVLDETLKLFITPSSVGAAGSF